MLIISVKYLYSTSRLVFDQTTRHQSLAQWTYNFEPSEGHWLSALKNPFLLYLLPGMCFTEVLHSITWSFKFQLKCYLHRGFPWLLYLNLPSNPFHPISLYHNALLYFHENFIFFVEIIHIYLLFLCPTRISSIMVGPWQSQSLLIHVKYSVWCVVGI